MGTAKGIVALGTALALAWGTTSIGTALAVEQAFDGGPVVSKPAVGEVDERTGIPDPDESSTDDESAVEDQELAGASDAQDVAHERFSAQSSAGNDARAMVPGDGRSAPEGSGTVEREGSAVYANGTPILIRNDSDGKAYVFDETGATKLDETPLASGAKVYGGGNGKDVEGDASVSIDGVSYIAVYGGGRNASVAGDVRISINNAATGTVYGGGYSDGSGQANVGGGVSIELTGTGVKSGIHGGGFAEASKGDASANVAGSVTLSCSDFNHQSGSSVYGGGYARTSSDFEASATVGGVTLSGSGPTYVVRGGGWASSSGSGAAHADVLGAVSIELDQVDVREVYGGGYANGAQATACAKSVEATVAGSEMMLLTGGGTASGGLAEVDGLVDIRIDGCSNLYGYTIGGGSASSAGSADVGSVAIMIRDSIAPVEKQWGDWVAQAVYAGGSASKAGSHADVKGPATLSIEGGSMAGHIYGGGEASTGASATVDSLSVSLAKVDGYSFDTGDGDALGLLSLFAAGETIDGGASPSFVQGPVDVQVSGMQVEELWGAISAADDSPFSPEAAVTVELLEGASVTSGLACVDRVKLSEELVLRHFLPKADGVPTIVSETGFSVGDTLVTCLTDAAEESWFALEDRAIGFQQDQGSARWTLTRASGAIAVDRPDESATPEVAVANLDEALAALLSPEDEAALDRGSSVVFSLKVESHEPEPEEARVLEAAAKAGSYRFAQHLDISLSKVVDGKETPLSTLGTSLQLTISVPDDFVDESRTFCIVRVHEDDGGALSAVVLEDQDDDPATVTIETDAFSTYSLAYSEEEPGGSLGTPDGEGGHTPPDDDADQEGSGNDGSGKGDRGDRSPRADSTEEPVKLPAGSLLATGDPLHAAAPLAVGFALIAGCTLCAVVVHRRRAAR